MLFEQPREMCHCWGHGDEPSANPQQPPDGQARTSRGAGSTRRVCSTQPRPAAGLCQNGLWQLREAQCSYESSDVQWRVWWIYALRVSTQQTDMRHNLWLVLWPYMYLLSLNNSFSQRSLEVCVGKVSWATTGIGQLCVCTSRLWANISWVKSLGEFFQRKIVTAEIKATTFTNDKKL